MNFGKWLMKKGAIGGATRLIIKAYNLERKKDKESPDSKIFVDIAKWRYSITRQEFTRKIIKEIANCSSLREFVKFLVVAERKLPYFTSDWKTGDWKTGPKTPRGMAEEVIDEICNEKGLD